jgi:hypothetical protein
MLTMIEWWRRRSSIATVSTPSLAKAESQLPKPLVFQQRHDLSHYPHPATLRQHKDSLYLSYRLVQWTKCAAADCLTIHSSNHEDRRRRSEIVGVERVFEGIRWVTGFQLPVSFVEQIQSLN